MTLLILFGPPAVGKFTVARQIVEQSDYKLFHNHQIMDGVMQLFGLGTPAEDRLSRLIRGAVIDEAAEARMNLIFTYVWNFALPKGKNNIDAYKASYESRGGQVRFVELTAPIETRIKRAGSIERAKLKPDAAGPARVAEVENQRLFESPNPFYYPELYQKIDTADRSPTDVASEIIALHPK